MQSEAAARQLDERGIEITLPERIRRASASDDEHASRDDGYERVTESASYAAEMSQRDEKTEARFTPLDERRHVLREESAAICDALSSARL